MWAADGQGRWAEVRDSLYAPLQDLVQRVAAPSLLGDPRAAAYWAYHTARLGFFIGQAAAGVAAHHLSEKGPAALLPAPISAALGPDGPLGALLGAARGPSGPTGGDLPAGTPTPFERLSANARQELASRVGEAVATFQQDWDNISSGAYPLPWDMVTPGHRQNNPLRVLSTTARFLNESVATLRRRVRGSPEPLWLKGGGLYPDYYQARGGEGDHVPLPDGRSAAIYEHSTEVLFLGRQDAMQRTSLLPLADFVRERAEQGVAPSQMRLLEVAAGTGRFHTFVKDAFPDLPSVVSDLSPFYLAKARDNLAYWARTRQAGRDLGGVDGCGAEFLQAPAEALAAPDESFDIVLNVYLMHELPQEARAAAAREFARVLRPGGLLVLSDSVQRGDRPAWDRNIGMFGAFNEPHYESYITCDLGALFQAAGLQPDTKYVLNVYLMHELPQEARAAAAREFARVLRPGGLLVLSDSVQRGDRPAWDRNIGMFGAFNEPHYESYITCDLGALFQAAGLQPDTKYVLNVYLMHELPQEARAAAAREFARVLRPGGLLVLSDGVQRGDRPAWDRNIGMFGAFNEPHYESYITCDLGALFQAAGLQPDTKYVLNVYLMHELPQEARAAAAREFARVLRPGGLLVLSDSVQRGDRPAWDRNIGMFGAFNEPHYESYITCDLGALFQAAGLQPDTKYVLNVYLMHELPQEARAAAAREFARVLRPGGLLVLSDSVQRGDRPAWDRNIGMFGAFNEPHYESYITCDLGALFQAAGLQPDTKYVLNVYLMHELPQEARAAAAREFARVLRPGGLLVLSDSVQRGDRPAWDRNIGMFGAFNEPHYESYITCDLGALFQAAGLQPDTKYVLNVYLMHELPQEARAAAAREFARVLRPGGLLVLSDSVQRGGPAGVGPQVGGRGGGRGAGGTRKGRLIGMFGAFNEPHYESYITCDLGALFQAAGLQPDTKYVLNVYLMHELPQEARAAAAREFARVLRPGGLLVLSDSVQRGDRPAWDRNIGMFGAFNEPHYESYITCDLGALFQAAGLQPDTKYVSSATKTLSFRKPLQG
ncbi:hypothetical protein HYH03_016479 [Edaphochlamys debaryana]|uniref:Methyltransferase type 11 domain-containing protein n=1 Tax=Edaphochlamys debaryana TaxID=47281 RepID=A0A835XKA1_9CHLO|nr:hypothetical protein HYH03_016479 [Edaphochlamys debaryana]|eukprot:KAG2484732.1 hypothetical protein HYH03_016479 [Edaphochlamys debaryana]